MTPPTNTYQQAAPPSQNRYIWLFVSVAIVLVGMFFGTRIYVDYNRTIHTAEERLLTQTRVIDENIATNLTVVNLMLNDVVTKLRDTSGGSQLNGYLKQQLVMTPGVRTLIITDSQGRCLYSNRDELLSKDFPKDRDYFKVPRDAPDKGMLFLSPPYTTILGKHVINITKPLIGQRHEFNGIVSVTFDPEYFSALLTSTIYTPDNRVSLVHGDGTVFIAVPEAKIPVTGVKVTQPGSAFLQHIAGDKPTSIRIAAGKTVGDKRIVAYRTNIPKGVRFDKQIIVAASRNQQEVLAVWRMDAGIEFAVYLLFASFSIVITRVMLQRGIELKRLEETRAHLAAIVEFSDDAIISKDINGVILSWNAGAERLFAYPPDEAIGRSITMLLPPELQDEENRILQSLKDGELVEHLETVRITKDGRRLDVSVTFSPLKDNTGTVIGASKIIRNITDRKLAEQELQAQSEELQAQDEELQNQNQELKELWEKSRQAEASLLESRRDLDRAQEVGSIGSWRLDVRINVLTWSDENYRIFGIPKGTPLTYETFLSIIHPDDRHYVNFQWNAGLSGEPYDIEHRLLVNDQVKWVREKAYLEFDEDGTLIGGFGITQDITARKQTEEALRESEFFFKESQRAASIGSYKSDFVTGRWESSEVLDAIFGIDSEYTRSVQGWLGLVHPDDRDMMDHYLREEVLAKRTPFSKEYRIVRKNNGETRWIHGLGEFAYDGNGIAVSLIGTIQDITVRKQTEEELILKNCELEAARILAEGKRRWLAAVMEALPVGIAITDVVGGTIQSNRVFEQIWAGPRPETRSVEDYAAYKAWWADTGTPVEPEEWASALAIRTGETVTGQLMRIQRFDGSIASVINSAAAVRNAGDTIVGCAVSLQDISELKRVEEALRESEERHRLLAETMLQGVVHQDANGTIISMNPAAERILGKSREEFLGNSSVSVEHDTIRENGELFPGMEHPTMVALRTGLPVGGVVMGVFNPKVEEYRWIGIDAVPVFRPGEKLPAEVYSVFEDITERKQAEASLRKIHNELELRIEERTADLVNAVDILEDEILERQNAELKLQRLNSLYAVLSETNQTIVKISDRNSLFRDFCRIAVEHGGFVLSWIGVVDGQSGKVNVVASSGVTAYLNDIRISAGNEPEGEGPTGISIREGTYYICNDFLNDPCTRPWHDQGKKFGICASASIAIKENDRVIGALTLYGGEKDYFDVQQVELLLQMGMDISFALDNLNRDNSQKEAEKALYEETSERLKAVEILREKEQMLIQQNRQAAMGEMIGNIAHQWRQPLNTLGLYTQKLGVFYGSPKFNKELLDDSIAKSMAIINHMSKTIDDFRDYFKPEKEKADFYVIEAIKNALSLLEGSFQNPKITIDFVEHGNPVINGYQNEFAQVFFNILNNARDAIIERKINDARVTITICSEDNCAAVTVADNAGGIPDEVINKVFDPYFTTKGPQLGTGIGLFMSKNIIEKNMGGRLTVLNTDVGAEFRIVVERNRTTPHIH